MDTKRSEAYYLEAVKRMPGGVNSPVRAFGAVGRTPIFIESAKGDRIRDVDGNEYIDYVCSWGPNILGHADEDVIRQVQKACEKGLTYGAPTRKESELAELIIDACPSIEMVRLVNSGTEAVMSAVRTARGYTGRKYLIKFSGCYHGHSDGLLVHGGSGLLTHAVPDSAGVPGEYSECTLVAGYNDLDSVREYFEKYPKEIACILVEPVAANMGVIPPKEGFLSGLRTIADQYGSILIFDEVITGFRLSLGGAAKYYQVEPDMTVLGKIVGGGMPLAAYGGRREIMSVVSPTGPVYQAGTLSGNPIAVTAGIATLKKIMDIPDFYLYLEKAAAKLEEAFSQVETVTVNRVGSLLSVFFQRDGVVNYDTAKQSDTEEYAKYFSYMLEHGIYIAPSQFEAMFVSMAHHEQDIEKTVEVIRGYFSEEV